MKHFIESVPLHELYFVGLSQEAGVNALDK
jgi:hypothetical protein